MQHAAAKSVRTAVWPRLSAMGLIDVLVRFDTAHRERRALERLDDRMLRDIGVTRAEVEREVARPLVRW